LVSGAEYSFIVNPRNFNGEKLECSPVLFQVQPPFDNFPYYEGFSGFPFRWSNPSFDGGDDWVSSNEFPATYGNPDETEQHQKCWYSSLDYVPGSNYLWVDDSDPSKYVMLCYVSIL